MRYLGGKSKIRKEIAKIINSELCNTESYFEPFVGGGWILQEITCKNRIASDGNKALITMYKELQKGWMPPDFVSESDYVKYKNTQDESDPMTAFVGFGCSFAGKWFGGYARSEGKNCYAKTSKNSLMKQLPLIKDVRFIYGMYEDYEPINHVIYCDPPYADTTQYGAFKGFDSDRFWENMREWSKRNTVFVSEYKAPKDFVCVLEIKSQMGMTTGEGEGERIKRNERLFMHESLISIC